MSNGNSDFFHFTEKKFNQIPCPYFFSKIQLLCYYYICVFKVYAIKMCMLKCVYLKWTCWFCVVTAEEGPTDFCYLTWRKKRVLAMDGWKLHGKRTGDGVRLRGFLKEWRCISGKEENTWLADQQELKSLKVSWCETLRARKGFGSSQVIDSGHSNRWCWNICPASCTVCLLNFWLSPTNPFFQRFVVKVMMITFGTFTEALWRLCWITTSPLHRPSLHWPATLR